MAIVAATGDLGALPPDYFQTFETWHIALDQPRAGHGCSGGAIRSCFGPAEIDHAAGGEVRGERHVAKSALSGMEHSGNSANLARGAAFLP